MPTIALEQIPQFVFSVFLEVVLASLIFWMRTRNLQNRWDRVLFIALVIAFALLLRNVLGDLSRTLPYQLSLQVGVGATLLIGALSLLAGWVIAKLWHRQLFD